MSLLARPCSAPPPSGPTRSGGEFALPPKNCTCSPVATKLGIQRERQTFRAQAKHLALHAGKPRGTLFPGLNRAPVPRQDATSLSLPLRSGQATQGAQTQHSSEQSDVQGELTAGSRWCPTNYKLGFQKPSQQGSSTTRQGRSQDLPELRARTPQPALRTTKEGLGGLLSPEPQIYKAFPTSLSVLLLR